MIYRYVPAMMAVFFVVSLLQACAILDRVQESELRAQILVSQTTLRVIEAADDPIQRRDRIRELIAQGQEYVDSEAQATIVDLDERARQEIRWQRLGVADQELINLVLIRAREELERAVGDGVLDADQRLQVAKVLTWADQAAQRIQ